MEVVLLVDSRIIVMGETYELDIRHDIWNEPLEKRTRSHKTRTTVNSSHVVEDNILKGHVTTTDHE